MQALGAMRAFPPGPSIEMAFPGQALLQMPQPTQASVRIFGVWESTLLHSLPAGPARGPRNSIRLPLMRLGKR